MRPHVWLGGGGLIALAGVASLFAPDAELVRAPSEDRVGFPAGYRTVFAPLRRSFKPQQKLVATTYANAAAAAIEELDALPYAYESIFVFEWTQPATDDAGAPILAPLTEHVRGTIVRVDVMRRGAGFGERYGADRAGEWEFASYRPDGTRMADEPELQQCARCHAKASERDFVFRGRFPPITPPP